MLKKITRISLFVLCFSWLQAQPVDYIWAPEIAAINDILEANDGSIWLATDSAVVQVSPTGQLIVHHYFQAFSVAQVGSSIWVGLDGMALRFSSGTWTTFASGNGLPASGAVRSIVGISSTVFWCVVGQQVYRFNGGTFTNMNQPGVSIAIDGDSVYVATPGPTEPILKYDGTNWTPLPNIQGAIPAFVNPGLFVAKDSEGYIWFQSTRGIFKFRNGNWTEVIFPLNQIGTPTLAVQDSTAYVMGPVQLFRVRGQSIDTVAFDYGTANIGGKRLAKVTRQKLFLTQQFGTRGYALRVFTESLGRADEQATLNINNLDCGIIPTGELGRSLSDFPGINGPDGMLVFAAGPWVQATKDNGRVAAYNMFRSRGGEWYSGPIGNQVTADYIQRYNRVWMVDKAMIEAHQQQFADSSYTMPDAIASWPGNGDVTNGEAAQLAPFNDLNGNGLYEPELGEHPELRGDAMVYTIFNDSRGPKVTSQSPGMDLEVHCMIYAFNKPQDPALHNSMYLTYKLFNRGQSDLEDLSFAWFADFDIGTGGDDAMGSDSIQEVFFSYNGTPSDPTISGVPPAIAGRALNWGMDGLMYFTNEATPRGNPTTPLEHENQMNFKWRDGSPLRLTSPSGPGNNGNGTGLDPQGSAPVTNWAFNRAANWYHPPSDVRDIRGLPVLKPMTLVPGQFVCLDFALSAGTGTDNLNSIQVAINHLEAAKDYYDVWYYNCFGQRISSETISPTPHSAKLFPNPVQAGGTLRLDLSFDPELITLTDFMGRTRPLTFSHDGQGFRTLIPESLAAGMYVIQVSGKGHHLVQKLMVQ
jgi:hypothetical protein